MRRLFEKGLKYQQKMVFNFLDFTKAFASVHREALWTILRHYIIPAKTVNLIKALYHKSVCCIRIASGDTKELKMVIGVRQG